MVGRFTDMEIRKLGRTNLQVSAIGFGGARLDEHPEQAVATVHRALDYGVNFIDTARDYGHSEKYLGQALQGRRSELVLATKVAFNHADFVQESVETSLAQLRVDDVDLIYAHGCNNAEHYRILMREQGMLHKLERIRSEGLTQFIGVSFDHFLPFDDGQTSVERMVTLIESDAFDVIQVPMSLIRIERVEDQVLPMAAERNLGVVVNFPTANGILTGDIGVFYDILDSYIATSYQGALLAPLLHPAVSCVLSGMSTPAFADENCALGSMIENISKPERHRLWDSIQAVGIGPCRSCGRCAPYTQDIPVRQIMTYHDAVNRFGVQSAFPWYEEFREQVLACDTFKGADAVCPEEFDVLAEVKKVYR
ncbi:TPA: aldo/keto reductase [Candidatus Poribacteria bacterium]|nr:aldo/keto reductase [Candidatus Poribacteria bacterium]